jgi:hypothetical protein
LLTPHWSPPLQVERFGEVLWTRYAINPDEDDLVAECRIRWVELTRFSGHLGPWGQGVHDAEESSTVPS